MSERIAIFHPEGNVPNNPHLSGLLERLLERGHEVHVYSSPQPGLAPVPGHPRLHVHLVPPPLGPWEPLRHVLFLPDTDGRTVQKVALAGLPRFSLVLGVDLGIVDAANVARAQGVPHGLLSYELYFAAEVGPDQKRPEIAACRDVAFALCQDAERSGHLARENGIACERIVNMPVAGRGSCPGARTFAVHEALGLDRGTKIAVSIGSVDAPWSGTGQILENVAKWPEDWALVLHHRYGAQSLNRLLAGLGEGVRRRVHASPFPSLPANELGRLLHSCDLGLCFYLPTYDHPLVGRNLEHIGMASGKFTTYLQHGLPVLVSDQGEMGGHVRCEGLGWQVQGIGETHSVLASASREGLDALRGNCLEFFARRCDFDGTSVPLLAAIEDACRQGQEMTIGADGGEPGIEAYCAIARLRMADEDLDAAAAALMAALERAGNAEDFEAIYAIALILLRRGGLCQAQAVFRRIHEDRRVGAALAAWALFKSGEASLEQGNERAAEAFFAQALQLNPTHAKAALFLAPPQAPLRVRLGAAPERDSVGEAAAGIAVTMDPLDPGLWRYYFSRRQPDHVEVRLNRPMTGQDAELLAGALAGHLAPGGLAVVRLPEGAPSEERDGPEASFAAHGLQAQWDRAEGAKPAALLVRLCPSC
ncbi:MAG: hypothetical protein KKF77_07195 [Proteobacteria bacterium]|nr:hypothetical protein [Pseudomonadota bacterium]